MLWQLLVVCTLFPPPDACLPAPAAAGGARAALGAVCCGAAVALAPPSVPPSERQLFARAWCLHELLLRRLDLPDRARSLPEAAAAAAEAQGGLRACLDAFHAAAATLLSSGNGASASGLLSCSSLADWLDGRLLHAVALSLRSGQAPAELAELRALSQLVQQAAAAVGGASCDLTQLETAVAELTLAAPQLPTAAEPVPPGPAAAASHPMEAEAGEASDQPPPFSTNELVQAILGPSDGSSGAGLALGSRLSASLAAFKAQPYKADHHWHSGQEGAAMRGLRLS